MAKEDRDREWLHYWALAHPLKPRAQKAWQYPIILCPEKPVAVVPEKEWDSVFPLMKWGKDRKTRLGEMWGKRSESELLWQLLQSVCTYSDSSAVETAKPEAVVAVEAAPAGGVAELFAAAFGEAPCSTRLAELLHAAESAPRTTGGPSEVFGAYALSAGLVSGGEGRPFDVFGLRSDDAVCIDILLPFGGKTNAVLAIVGESPSTAERLAALADLLAVWRSELLARIQDWLSPSYEFIDHVPPVACSPCGVIRMASPEVPRGPELGLHLDTCRPFWALAA